MKPSLLTVVLGAGKGTRMKSAKPKVLHAIAGRSMLGHVLSTAAALGASRQAVVIGPDMDAVRVEALRHASDAAIYVQSNQLGTADAVLAAREALAAHTGDVLVLYADTPLITEGTLRRLIGALDDGANVAVLGFTPDHPTGYGRLVTDEQGDLVAIREEKDASPEERKIRLCNSGVIAFRCPDLLSILDRIGNANAKGEYYLTDAVEIARNQEHLRARVVEGDADEVLGVNSRVQLAEAEAVFQRRARIRAMEEGATMIAPHTVFLSYDTRIGRDVIIEPNVFFGPGVTIDDGVIIKANCHIEGADAKVKTGLRVATGAEIGPFARLRPGAEIGRDVHIGNFVEVKNATMEAGAKANHLAYIGDGHVGAKANIGAGTIFCNYDGFNKHRTVVGEGAFVGSNSSLVAPVKIGAGAYVGSGSVITKEVEAGALAVERSQQDNRPGWAQRFRERMQRRKDRG
jgi:bifunctional UDP-N-acetylglucosamine pyrophosphorylase/glucosamine-1-phosphate N-acetyltransferase